MQNWKSVRLNQQGISSFSDRLMDKIDLLAKDREEEIYQKLRKKWGDLSNIDPIVLEFELWREMFGYLSVDVLEEARGKIKYREFLRSPYWRVVTNYVRYTRKVCEYCRAEEGLKVYHRTLEHIGYEILYMDDIEYLCRRCRADNLKHKRKKKAKSSDEKLFEILAGAIKKNDKNL